jgi:sugar lactone lactonase YvrE
MNALFPATHSPAPLGSLNDLVAVGQGLSRPECVLTTSAGHIYCADWRGGVAHLRPDGMQSLYLGQRPDGQPVRPNGIALLADGSFLLTQLGEDDGGVYRLQRDGVVEPWLLQVNGVPLPPTNFVVQDGEGRTWVTVSTRRRPRALGYRRDCDDGFIVRVDADGRTAIAAEGLGYTNEVALHPDGRWLYVNETFARRLSRFALHGDGRLGAKEVVCHFGPGTFPDGLAFDEEGCVWVVSVVSNRLLRVTPDGQTQVWLEDADPDHLAAVEAAWESGTMGRPHLDGVRSQRLKNISSIAFCGPERRQALLGCLLGDHLERLTLPSPGIAPHHWHHP